MRTEKFNLCKSTKKLLTLITLLTLGVGQTWADVDYVVGCAATNSNNYSVRLNVNRQEWGWYEWTMSQAGLTFEGKKLYIKKYETKNGWVNDIQFLMKDGSGTQKEYKSAYAGSGTQGYSNQIYNYDAGSWYTKLEFSTSARFYFDASTWDETSIKLVIGHANYQKYYSLSNITNTKLYYGSTSDAWGDAMHIGVVGNTSASDGTNWPSDISDKASEYTGLKNYALSSAGAGNVYLMVPNGDTGQQPSMSYYATHYNTDALNSTQTIKYAVGVNGGTPATLTSGYVPADIAISSYKFASGTYNAVSSSSGSVTLSKGGSNYSATVTAARTATTTYTVSNVHEDYSFVGWYSAASGGTLLSSELSYTFYPTSATTAYARFSKENNHTVTISRYCTSTSSDISSTSAKIGEVTYSSIEAPEIYGYTFVNWTLESGVTKHTSDALTANPIRVKTAASGTYSMRANYTEVLTTDWKLIGDNASGSPFGDNYSYASGKAMSKKSGYSANYDAYYTLNITQTGTWGFKVASSNASANTYGWGTGSTYITFNRSKSGSKQDVYGGGQHELKFNPDGLGEYEFKVDYTASPCSVTVTFPTVYTVTYSTGSVAGTSGSISATYSSVSFASGTKIQSGKSVTLTAPAAKTGYTWKGWYTNAAGTTGKIDDVSRAITVTVDAAKTLYACYTEHKTAITINTDGHGTITTPSPNNSPYSLGVATTQAINASPNTGYHWNTWTVSGNATLASTAATQSNTVKGNGTAGGTGTVTATFTPNTYSIHFNGNGSTSGSMDNQTGVTYDAATNITTNAFVKTGYNFAGWALSSDGSVVRADGADHGNLASTQGATAQLWAVWTPKTCTVNFDFDSSDPGHGDHTSATTSTSATYDAAMTSVTPPTAATGYAFMGYFTGADGAGTQYYDGSGNSAKNWAVDTEVPTTLYAYYKKAEITGITFSPRTTIEPGATVTVTPTISPTPVDPVIVCWRVLYNNDNPLSPQPTFTPVSGNTVSFPAHEASGTYKLEATLRTGAACGSGTVLDTYVATFHVAGDHSVTILYQDASGNTIKASESVIASAIDYTDFYITAPDIFGYTFSQWNAYDGVKIKDSDSDEKDESEIQTIKIRAIYDGRLVAKYTQKSMIYFKNTLGWEDVYVNFYSSTEYTWNASNGSGNAGVTNRNKHMTQIDDTDIWYYDYGEASITPERFVSFTSADQSNASNFWASNPGVDVVYPTRYMDALNTDKSSEAGFKAATPMFVPLAGQTPTILNSANNGKANYYNRGYWTKYTPGTGYTLEIYNSEGNSLLKSVEFTSEDELMPMKAVVDLEAGATYKYQLRRGGTGDNGIYYGNSGTMTYNEHGQTNAWEMINTMSPRFSMCGITTNAAGNYTFNLSYSANASNEYRLRMEVDYPIASGDYRVVYKDNVCTQSKASAIITKENNGKDTVSFFIRPENSPVLTIQQSSVNSTTGAITWSNYSTITSSISSLSKDSVYNICLTMNESGAISVEKVEVYTGNYYIRTDAANSKWDNYRSDPDHLMTYSEYSINHGGYSHYYCHWVDKNDAGRKNVKFCIANDYSPSISDTLIRETASGTWANINNYIESNGDLKRNANVRFMWNRHDNTISRAYVDGAQDDLHAFLELISGDSKIRNAETEVIMSEVTFTDKENWLYEADIQAQPNAQIRLKSTWGESNVIEQYFKGSSTTTEALIGGSGSTWYDIRLLYDFKTNRLVAAYKPSGNITDATAINADIMFIREHQGDISQLTFSGSGTITDIKTAYGVIRFNKWILNNMEPSGNTHPVLAEPKSLYERSLFWISFPFRVKLSEVFGFGTYGSHWAIQYYDGADRAARGHFLENGTFWKWLNRSTAYLEPNQGYLLAIDVDLLGINSDVWGPNSRSEQIELYFPSTGTMPNLTSADVVQTIPEHTCSINRAASEGLPDTGDPRTSYNRTIFDSHWNVLSVPTYVNTNNVTFANTDWTTEGPGKRGPNFLYTWNSDDNTITATAARGYTYHAMHSYMVQYCNTVTWAAKSGSPYTIVARKTYEEAPREIEFRLEIQQNEKMIDRTYVVLSNDEEVSANFAFGEDMVKEFNARKAAIFNYTADNVGVAGNTMPMSEQTTVIPVGLEIPTAGEYTFAIPDGTEGIGVILVDNVANTRTNLSALDYTVNLTTGTHDGRFVLEISPIHNATTGIEAVSDEGLEITGARKMIIDQKLYIVKDGKLFDATGKRVE